MNKEIIINRQQQPARSDRKTTTSKTERNRTVTEYTTPSKHLEQLTFDSRQCENNGSNRIYKQQYTADASTDIGHIWVHVVMWLSVRHYSSIYRNVVAVKSPDQRDP